MSGLAFAVLAFARRRDQWQLVRDDPSLARNAFEEVIRHLSPVTGFFRTTTTEVTWDDVVIPARRKVMVLFAGANRTPAIGTGPTTSTSAAARPGTWAMAPVPMSAPA